MDRLTRLIVGLILWSAGEQCMTMLCLFIPACLPLLRLWTTKVSRAEKRQSFRLPSDGLNFATHTIGGTAIVSKNTSNGVRTANVEDVEIDRLASV
jgi:hypothetical protein